MRRRLLVAALAVVLVAAGAVAAYVLYTRAQGGNVRGSSSVEFVPSQAPPTTAPAPTVAAKRPAQVVWWPTYGYDAPGLRAAVGIRLRPPFRLDWTFHHGSLLEFPPVVAYGRLFLSTWDGHLYALNARTGEVVWHHATGRCGWGSPAIHRHVLFVTLIGHDCLSPVPGHDGEVVAYDAGSGAVRWIFPLGPCESSPLVANGLVYVGDWNGKVWALDEATGRPRWSYQTGDRVKSSASLAGGRIYIGSYDGHVYAFDALTGRLAWRASGQPRLGGSGTFYSTPTVAYGRVYAGSTDDRMYSFGAASGKLRWSYGTGGYVYSSAAVWRQLVFVGSYDHVFYAFDAATGVPRWRFQANGPISGSPSVVDGVVYFSTLAERTYALEAATGKLLWTWPDGKYSPVVADGTRLYVVGYGRLFAFLPAR